MNSSSKQRKISRLLQRGDLQAARDLCTRLCNKQNSDAQAWALLAEINAQMGSLQEALQCLQKAAQFAPADAKILSSLGSIYHRLGNISMAEQYLSHAVTINPVFAESWFGLGAVHTQLGKFDQAISCYRKVLQIEPGHIATLINLGNALHNAGRFNEAINNFQAAANLQPKNANIYGNIAISLISSNSSQEAVRYCNKAISLQPGLASSHAILGKAYLAQGEFEEALESFRGALTIDPNQVDAIAGEITSLERLGKYSEALQKLNPLIKMKKLNTGLLVSYATLSQQQQTQAKAVSLIEKFLEQQHLNVMQQVELHFSLGKLYDCIGSYNKAFKHYSVGNRLTPVNFDIDAMNHEFQALIDVFSNERFYTLPRAVHSSHRPVFIIGMPRSGTSLVEQILASHPAVYGAGELDYLMKICASAPGLLNNELAYPEVIRTASQADINLLSKHYLDQLNKLSGTAEYITDKMPHNFMHIGLISLLFPQAKIIHCKRNPMDTCLSCYFQVFSGSNGYAYDLEMLGRHYRQYRWIMDYWKNTLGIEMLEVEYEKLIEDQEKTSREILRYCNLPWDENCLEFYKSNHQTRTASYAQTRQPIYTGSRQRWKKYEQHLAPLIRALGNIVG